MLIVFSYYKILNIIEINTAIYGIAGIMKFR